MGYMGSYYNIPKAIFYLRKGGYAQNPKPEILVSIFFSIIPIYPPYCIYLRGTIGSKRGFIPQSFELIESSALLLMKVDVSLPACQKQERFRV